MADNQRAVVYYQWKGNPQSFGHRQRTTVAPGGRQSHDNTRALGRSNGRARAGRDLALRGEQRAIYIDGDKFDILKIVFHNASSKGILLLNVDLDSIRRNAQKT